MRGNTFERDAVGDLTPRRALPLRRSIRTDEADPRRRHAPAKKAIYDCRLLRSILRVAMIMNFIIPFLVERLRKRGSAARLLWAWRHVPSALCKNSLRPAQNSPAAFPQHFPQQTAPRPHSVADQAFLVNGMGGVGEERRDNANSLRTGNSLRRRSRIGARPGCVQGRLRIHLGRASLSRVRPASAERTIARFQ